MNEFIKNFCAVLIISLGLFSSSLIYADFTNSPQAKISNQRAIVPEIAYPVEELGGCKDKAECFAYCEVPENNRACLNFAKEHKLLSEEEIHVAEKVMNVSGGGPGGCKSKSACESYCDDVSHIDECLAFAEENGLMKGKDLEEAKKVQAVVKSGGKLPGGCKNKIACESYCQNSEHMEECLAFAEKSGFLSQEELEQAKKFMPLIKEGLTPGGCKSKDECETYCERDEHFDECISFAEKNGMIKEKDRQNIEVFKKSGGKGPGGCKGRQCETFCKDPNNQQTCFDWAKENGLVNEDDRRNIKENLPSSETGREEVERNFNGPGGCKNKEECMNYCQNNPEGCKRFAPPQKEKEKMDRGINQEEDKYREQYQGEFQKQYKEGQLKQQFQERPQDSFERRENPPRGFIPEGEPRALSPDSIPGGGKYYPEYIYDFARTYFIKNS